MSNLNCIVRLRKATALPSVYLYNRQTSDRHYTSCKSMMSTYDF